MSIWKKASAALEFLPKQNCGDRSLDDLESISLCYENQWAVFRDHDTEQSRTNLHLCYKILIAPVAELLTEPKIIIVPDSCLYQIPFAALSDKGGEYLSEAFGLRIVPSLTTLKLVLDSSPEYHSHTNALIMGDPVVGEVIYKERRKNITPLPCAKGKRRCFEGFSWRDIVDWRLRNKAGCTSRNKFSEPDTYCCPWWYR